MSTKKTAKPTKRPKAAPPTVEGVEAKSKGALYYYDPDDLEIVTEKGTPLYDIRGEKTTTDPALVATMRRHGNTTPVRIAHLPGHAKPCVVDGRQRVLAARQIKREQVKSKAPATIRLACVIAKDPGELELLSACGNIYVPETPIERASRAAHLTAMGHSDAEICVAMGVTAPTLEGWRTLRGAPKEAQKAVQAGETTASAVIAATRAGRKPREHKPRERHHMSIRAIRQGLAIAESKTKDSIAPPGVASMLALLRVIAGEIQLDAAPAEVQWLLTAEPRADEQEAAAE